MRRIARTIVSTHNPKIPHKDDPWTIVAQKFGGVILLSEQSKVYDGKSKDLHTFSGHKFEQYMTTDANGRADTDSPIDTRATFEMMVQSTLSVGSESLSICVGAKIDALRGEDPIELNTVREGCEYKPYFNIHNVLQNEIVGVKSSVYGLKNDRELAVYKVIERKMEDIKCTSKGFVGKQIELAYSFLFTVLSEVKQFLSSHDACEITFHPSDGWKSKSIELKRISREEAKANGNGVTDEFLDRFNL